jgi:hypothetical protein
MSGKSNESQVFFDAMPLVAQVAKLKPAPRIRCNKHRAESRTRISNVIDPYLLTAANYLLCN